MSKPPKDARAAPRTPNSTDARAALRLPPRAPAAPPVYRPQPTPKVLQRKSALDARAPHNTRHSVPHAPQQAAPQVSRNAPPPQPRAVPQKPAPRAVNGTRACAQLKAAHGARPAAASHVVEPKPSAPARPAPKGGAVQRVASKVVQAIKLYPNLHPGAVERVETDSVFKLSNFADQYRLRKTQSHGVYVPNQLYNFVRTSEGDMLLHNRYRHPSIAEGRQVLYAGEVYFNNGKLEWWSNGSGHYQPDSEDAQQAALPMDNFYSYQQVIKGEHKRKKG